MPATARRSAPPAPRRRGPRGRPRGVRTHPRHGRGRRGRAALARVGRGIPAGRPGPPRRRRLVLASPDGRLVLTAGDDPAARLWDAETGTPAGILEAHAGPVRSAAFRPDGTVVATGGDDGLVRFRDIAGGRAGRAPLGHPSGVTSLAFSPDGRTLVAGCEEGTAHLWDASAGSPVAEPWSHSAAVTCTAISPDGTRALAAGRETGGPNSATPGPAVPWAGRCGTGGRSRRRPSRPTAGPC